jgi:phosphoribosylamine--glycine ligase
MGDPETQPIMMRLKSDLFDVMMAATSGTLDQVELTGTAAPRWAW